MISHGLGLILFLCLSPLLITYSSETGNNGYYYGCLIFLFSLLMVYTSSTLYHSVYEESVRKKLRIFDHISIYFLIAGSYSPFIFVHVNSMRGYIMLGVLWTIVLVGSIFKYFYVNKYNLLSTIGYILMGLLAVFIIKPIYQGVDPISFNFLLLGGAFYLVGTVFYLWESLFHNHLIWHLFVLAGSFSHFMAIYYCL